MRRVSEKLGDFSHPLVDVTGLTHCPGHVWRVFTFDRLINIL